MIADHETNVVYVADTLERRFPSVYGGLKTILDRHEIPLRTIPGTRDIWCRDYMPVQVGVDRFVQFRYAPDYLTGKHRHLRADGKVGPTLPWMKNCVRSEIVLDGGNVVKWCDKVIMNEKIFDENPRWERRRLLVQLEKLLEVGRIVLIPPEPGDVTGHSDGVVRFVDGGTVVVNDYRRVDRDYRRAVLRRLKIAGLVVREVPYRPALGCSDGMPSAVGNYVNFLQIASNRVVPYYGLTEDELARKVMTAIFPSCSSERLNCLELARAGGVLNCCTWAVKESIVCSRPESEEIAGAL